MSQKSLPQSQLDYLNSLFLHTGQKWSYDTPPAENDQKKTILKLYHDSTQNLVSDCIGDHLKKPGDILRIVSREQIGGRIQTFEGSVAFSALYHIFKNIERDVTVAFLTGQSWRGSQKLLVFSGIISHSIDELFHAGLKWNNGTKPFFHFKVTYYSSEMQNSMSDIFDDSLKTLEKFKNDTPSLLFMESVVDSLIKQIEDLKDTIEDLKAK